MRHVGWEGNEAKRVRPQTRRRGVPSGVRRGQARAGRDGEGDDAVRRLEQFLRVPRADRVRRPDDAGDALPGPDDDFARRDPAGAHLHRVSLCRGDRGRPLCGRRPVARRPWRRPRTRGSSGFPGKIPCGNFSGASPSACCFKSYDTGTGWHGSVSRRRCRSRRACGSGRRSCG
jgi:hypothetical protein